MAKENLGNDLNNIVNAARAALYEQGELAELTYGAFDTAVRELQARPDETIQVVVPIGYNPDRTTMISKRGFHKQELVGKYQFLAFHQLAVNGLMQLVTIVEAMPPVPR